MQARPRLLPTILAAALATFLTAPPCAAQKVELVELPRNVVGVVGGDGVWKMTYGKRGQFYQPQLLVVTPSRAFVGLGPWLRLIDSDAGQVIGRWRFPGLIIGLKPRPDGGTRVDVEIGMSPYSGEKSRTLPFDAVAPAIPNWIQGSLIALTASQYEAAVLFDTTVTGTSTWTGRTIKAEEAAVRIEDMVKRDPFAPWLRIAWGKVLHDLGNPRANTVFDEAVRSTTTDFSELFMISRTLEHMGLHQQADVAYDRAYADFIARGHDPRLMTTLLARLILYSPVNPSIPIEDSRRAELVERIYQLAPTSEETERAWAVYAGYLERMGDTQAARVWFDRAEQSRRESLLPLNTDMLVRHDVAMLVTFGTLLAALLLIVALWVKNSLQRRLQMAADTRLRRLWRRGAFGVEYWSTRERLTLVVLILIGWYSTGVAVGILSMMGRSASLPISVGSLSGPDHVAFFKKWPQRPSRDLLLAIAYQQEGNLSEAERWYRALPDYAESWNNLGVLLQHQGKVAEANAAFTRALQIDPQLAEAVLNTGGKPATLPTIMHQRYTPGRLMLAMPRRDHMLEAASHGSWSTRYWRALLGPLAERGLLRSTFRDTSPAWALGPSIILAALLAIVLLVSVARREVTQAAPKVYRVLEIALPGLAPGWRFLAAPALLCWVVVITSAVLWAIWDTPFIFARSWLAALSRAFGLPSETASGGIATLNPNPLLLAGLAIAVMTTNLVLVLRGRRV